MVKSEKDKFKIKALKILKINNKNCDDIQREYPEYIDRILDFQLDVVEIHQNINPNFKSTDLFLRLNTKPYPISANSFEMWNSYVDMDITKKIKEIAEEYIALLMPKNNRMKNEELITTLAYLDYKERIGKINLILDIENKKSPIAIFIKSKSISIRIKSKENITTTLSHVSQKNNDDFIESIENVNYFFKKISVLLGNDLSNINQIFNPQKSRKNAKTNQNFYLLWILLNKFVIKDVESNSKSILSEIIDIFSYVTNVSDIAEFYSKISKFNSLNK